MKQVIVMRKDLNMRKGKMIAQGSHAVVGVLKKVDAAVIEQWEENGQSKICVSVSSEEELLRVYQQACTNKLPAYLVRDAGRTEFNGVPTLTCCAIGPAEDHRVDEVTGSLSLL